MAKQSLWDWGNLGSQAFGNVFNIGRGLWSDYQQDQFFQNQIEPGNRFQENVLGQVTGQSIRPQFTVAPEDVRTREDLARWQAETGTTPPPNVNAVAGRTAAEVNAASGYFSPGKTRFRYAEALNPTLGSLARLPGEVNAQNTAALNQYQSEADTINMGYAELLDRARGLVSSRSDQDRADANRRFDVEGAANRAFLTSRGLGGSTIGPSIQTGVERGRADELRRISDQEIDRSLGVETTFGAGGLAARQASATNLLSGTQYAANQRSTTGLNSANAIIEGNLSRLSGEERAALIRLGIIDDTGRLLIDTAFRSADTITDYYGGRTLGAPAPPNYVNVQPDGSP